MQERKRKKRCYKRFKLIRGSEASSGGTCSKVSFADKSCRLKSFTFSLLALSSLLLFQSCATTNNSISTYSLEKTLSSVCLSQEGKGRFEEKKRKVFFSYESLFKKDSEQYLLSLDFPLYGTELITVQFEKEKQATIELGEKGGANKRLQKQKNLQKFLKIFTDFVLLKTRISEFGSEKYCKELEDHYLCNIPSSKDQFQIKKLKESVHVYVGSSISKKRLSLEFFELNDQHFFSRVRVSYSHKAQHLKSKPFFKGELFVSDCHDKKSH